MGSMLNHKPDLVIHQATVTNVGICKYLVAACLQVKVSLPGLEQLPKKFLILRRKKRNQ
jgi:hypothetical protein